MVQPPESGTADAEANEIRGEVVGLSRTKRPLVDGPVDIGKTVGDAMCETSEDRSTRCYLRHFGPFKQGLCCARPSRAFESEQVAFYKKLELGSKVVKTSAPQGSENLLTSGNWEFSDDTSVV